MTASLTDILVRLDGLRRFHSDDCAGSDPPCFCGADAHNAAIDALAADLRAYLESDRAVLFHARELLGHFHQPDGACGGGEVSDVQQDMNCGACKAEQDLIAVLEAHPLRKETP